MSKIKLSSIAAMAKNRAIGKDNELLWHIPKDFKHFKDTTMGKPMIMGRKTYDSLPGELKNRMHIIISRSADPANDTDTRRYVTSIDNAVALGREIAENDNVEEVFVIGGAEIYTQTLPMIDRLYLTIVHRDYDGDAHFPEFDWDEWDTVFEEEHEAETDKNRPAFTLYTLERKAA